MLLYILFFFPLKLEVNDQSYLKRKLKFSLFQSFSISSGKEKRKKKHISLRIADFQGWDYIIDETDLMYSV